MVLRGSDEPPAEVTGEVEKHLLVDQVALGSVRQEMPAPLNPLHPRLHADVRREPAEEEAAGPQHSPHLVHHPRELLIVFREVQDSAAQHGIGERVRESHALDGLVPEVRLGQTWCELPRYGPDRRDRSRIFIHAKDVEAVLEEVDEVSAAAAPCVDYAHARGDAPTQELIEEVDIDLAELVR